jgi:hypothetical protein
MRTPYTPARRRRILCVSPRYAPSFGTFHHAYPLFGGRIRAFMPAQGLLVVAAYLPESWAVRFVDENARAATDADLRWADVVLVSGMHVQRPFIQDVIARAHAAGRPAALGGPSVSASPEDYPDADLVHVYALPRTPLWRRLEKEGRLRPGGGESNVVFRLPGDTVLHIWRRCIAAAYEPSAVYGRFAHHFTRTFARRPDFPVSPHRASWPNVRMGFALLGRILWRIGVLGSYRRVFWRLALPALRKGQVAELIQTAVVSHHLIQFTRGSLRGDTAAFYAPASDPASEVPSGHQVRVPGLTPARTHTSPIHGPGR